METGETPHPGYFDTDALNFAVEIVNKIVGFAGEILGSIS